MLTAAEARVRGTASADQRAELRALIASKTVPDEWLQRFFRDVRAAEGLSRGRASAALVYLRGLADKADQPTYATPEQADEIRGLIRTRLVPGRLAMLWLSRLDAGAMTYDQAVNTLRDLHRAALRPFVAPDGARRTTSDAPDGHFALTGHDGQVRCYRIFTVAGSRRVAQITGDGNLDHRRLRGWQGSAVMRAVALNVAAAAALYGKTRRRCSDCDEPLGDPADPGHEHGYDTDCWAARQQVAANTSTRPDSAAQES